MRDSFGNCRLIFKNTEETRCSLPGVAGHSMCGLHRDAVMTWRWASGLWIASLHGQGIDRVKRHKRERRNL